jgi:hypothetical protein
MEPGHQLEPRAGVNYTPYAGKGPWIEAANRKLANLAKANFELRRR